MSTSPEPVDPTTVAAALHRALGELGIDEADITPGARLREDLELDSTEIVQVSLDLTRLSGTKVKLEADTDYTVEEVVALVVAQAVTGEPVS